MPQVASISPKSGRAASAALPLASIAALFALWGLAQCDFSTLLYQLTGYFTMDPAQVGRIPVVLNVTYFLVAIPAAAFHRRFGYKLGILVGLCLSSFGPFLLYPAIAMHAYVFFAASVMVMTIGWPFLETCLNPLAMDLGRPETAVRRLNFVQSFFPVGAAIGIVLATSLLNFNLRPSDHAVAQTVAQPFIAIGIGVLVLALAVEKVGFPGAAPDHKTVRIRDELRSLLARKEFRIALGAIALCQLAQATCWGTSFYLVSEEIPGAPQNLGPDILLGCCIAAAVGRFAGTALMRRFEPLTLLGGAMAAAVVVNLSTAAFGGSFGIVMGIATSLFLSIAYPTIFGTAICDLGVLKKTASGLLVTFAGIGTALELLVVNTLHGTIPIRYLVLTELPCFLAILGFVVLMKARQR